MNLKFSLSLAALALALMIASEGRANEFAITAGPRFDNADTETAGNTIEARLSYQAGVLGFIELGGPHFLRSGFEFATRAYGLKTAGISIGDARFTNFDVPLTYLYRFSDYGGAFAGPVVSFNFSKDCPGGPCTGANSTPLGLQIGASFKIAPQIGAEIYYETLTSKLATGIESPKAFVAQFYFSFE